MNAPDAREISDLLPLRPVVFATLLALRAGPCHGFGIMERVNGRLGASALVGPGTLYRMLKELRDGGLVEHVAPPADAPDSDGRRQYYRLSEIGSAAVTAEAHRIADLLAASGLADLVADASSR